jgi:hypothetical protein
MTPAFQIKIQSRKSSGGFFMTFANGYTVSVQFSEYNYSDSGQTDAEVAVWHNSGDQNFIEPKEWKSVSIDNGDQVAGYLSPEDVAKIIHEFSTK